MTGSEERMERVIRENRLVVVLYGSAGCGPCMAIREKLDRWQAEHPGVFCLYIPLEQAQALAAQNGIYAAPAVLVYMDGREMLRQAGCFSLMEVLSNVEFYIDNLT